MEVIKEDLLNETIEDRVDAMTPNAKRKFLREQRQKLLKQRLLQVVNLKPKISLLTQVQAVETSLIEAQSKVELDLIAS